MKQLSLLVFLLLGWAAELRAQDNAVNLTLSGGAFKLLAESPRADFTKPVKITCTGDPVNFQVKKKSDNISDPAKQADGSFDINVNDRNAESIRLELTADGANPYTLEIENAANKPDTDKTSLVNNKEMINFLRTNIPEYNILNGYDRKRDRAYFFFDPNGVLIGPAPVNIDADDYIEIFVAVPISAFSEYSVEMVGDYNPSDLAIRAYDPIAAGVIQGTTVLKQEEFTYVHQIFGPFTSDKATIKIYRKDDEDKRSILSQADVRINKLYNVAIGASFVSTNLANPDFDVFPISGTSDNTIRKVDDGKRTMVTLNVIYYWRPTVQWITGKLRGSSHITRGRDILKEPVFWERLNPVFGVALSEDWKENFFFGGNFEFARGGSISAGWHYGKVQSLADDTFQLGQDVFTGTKEDIKLTHTWEWAGFFAITVDTRIFNALFPGN